MNQDGSVESFGTADELNEVIYENYETYEDYDAVPAQSEEDYSTDYNDQGRASYKNESWTNFGWDFEIWIEFGK